MNHLKLIVFAVFAVSLAAGLVAGKLGWQVSAKDSGPGYPSPLAGELGLSPQQCEQIRGVWEPLRQSARSSFEQAKHLESQRDLALEAILTKEQKERYGEIKHAYDDQVLALQARRNTQFRDAVEKTKRFLTAEQRAKYEQMVKDRLNGTKSAEREAGGPAAAGEALSG